MLAATMKYIGPPQSGSQQATTASRNRYGQYYRNRAVPVNPRTAVQTAQRSLFGAAASAWRSLSSSTKIAWNSYAATMPKLDRLGQTVYWSGFQSYVECYVIRAGIAVSAPTDPPADVTFAQLLISSGGDFSDQSLDLNHVPSPIPAGFKLQIDATTSYSGGVHFAGPSEYRRILNIAVAAVSPADISAEYLAVWGVIGPAGSRIFVRGRLISLTGCAGPWATYTAEVSA